jgi:flavin reductase (DIM6/NTAB) family NADH-FMN oxidoreductase RutF
VVPQIAAAVSQAAEPQTATPQQAVAPAVAVQHPQQVYQPQQTAAVPENQSSGMEGYRKIAPDKIPGNVMKMISQDWMLITAGNREKFNMMTASWGGFGILYNKPVAICFINPARYTYSIIEGSDTFTLTFYTEAYRDALQYCGTKSGRDEDKVKGSGLTPMETQNGAMAFSQAWMVVECRKMLSQSLSPDAIADPAERAKRAAQPMHKMYIGEILNVWVK